MPYKSKLINSKDICIIDTSVAINLISTGCVDEIVKTVPNRLVVVDSVSKELERGRHKMQVEMTKWDNLVSSGIIKSVTLNGMAENRFVELAIGEASQTLDDGEAATIAYAVESSSAAFIDEKKANRICSERYPELNMGCTGDIFSHPVLLKKLGKERLATAVFNALNRGRMQVLSHCQDWVVELIGIERASLCSSLPRSIRAEHVINK